MKYLIVLFLLVGSADAQNGKPYNEEVNNAIRILRRYNDEHGEYQYCELLRQASIRLHGTDCFYFGGTISTIQN